VKDTVVFLEGRFIRERPALTSGSATTPQLVPTELSLSGTGFLILLRDSRLGPDKGITFLVTNKHLIREPGPDPEDSLGKGRYLSKLFLRINTKDPVDARGDQVAQLPLSVLDERKYLE
jgi:hypothetical protein